MTERMERLREYTRSGVAPFEAAVMAGYSRKYAHSVAGRLPPDFFADEVAVCKTPAEKSSENTAQCIKLDRESIIRELSVIASADAGDFITVKDGVAAVKDLDTIPPEKRGAVASVKNSAGGRGAEIHLYDKLKAIDLLCRCLGIYSADEPTDELEMLDRVLEAVGGSNDEQRG